jgi:hypothetical protein
MEQSEAPHDDERWQSRRNDIPRLVDSAVDLVRKTKAQVDTEVARLAQLSTVEYELERRQAARKLGLRTGKLDELVEVGTTKSEKKSAAAKPNATRPERC